MKKQVLVVLGIAAAYWLPLPCMQRKPIRMSVESAW